MATTTGISFDGVDDEVTRTITGTASSDKKFTIAAWVEVASSGGEVAAFETVNGSQVTFGLAGDAGFSGIIPAQRAFFYIVNDNGEAMLYHSPSNITYGTKYFMMLVYDSAQATQANRLKVWFGPYNGAVALISGWTDFLGTGNTITLNATLDHVGLVDNLGKPGATISKGKMADVYWLDNVALADPSSLLSNYASAAAPGIYAGSYGNTGYHLDFSNSGSLGADSSGNSNTFTPAGGPTQLTSYFPAGGTTLAAAAGSYSITGTAATLRRGKVLAAAAGSYAVTGTAATLRRARKTAAAAGSYTVTGTAAGLKLGRRVTAAAGSYALTGTTAGLKRAGRVAAAAGSYSMAGTAAGVLHGWKVSATAGAYALTGTAATLRHGWRVTAAAGSYTLTGTAANLSKSITGKSIVAGIGSYDLTGTAATLRHAWVAAAAAGSYALTGVAATLTKATPAKAVAAGVGTYSLTGTDATLVKSQVQSGIITGGAGYWPEHKPKYRVHPEYDDTPAPKPKRKVKKVGPQIVIEGDPVIQTGIIETRPAWDALVELQQMRDAAEAERIRKLKALLLADDEWLMSA